MAATSSSFWITTLSGVKRGVPRWAEIAHYLEPVRRYLAWRFPHVPVQDRDDIAQSVLVDMHQRLIGRYDASISRFRTYLKAAILNKVRDWWRERRPLLEGAHDLPDLAAPPMDDDQAAAIDLEAELLRAIQGFHDHRAYDGARGVALVRCFGYRVLEGAPEKEIARRLRLSRDQVKDCLAAAREEILRRLAGALLARGGRAPDDDERSRMAGLVRRGIRKPKQRERILAEEPDRAVCRTADDLLRSIDAARKHFLGLETEAGREFLRTLEDIFLSP